MKPALASLALACCLGLLLGCGDDGGPAEGGNTRLSYELFSTTKQLDAETLAALRGVDEARTLVTFDTATPLLEALEPDDVLLGGATEVTPAGLLARVRSVELEGGQVVVHTEPASIFHAFRRLELDMDQVPLSGQGTELALPSPAPPSGAFGSVRQPLSVTVPLGTDAFDEALFDGDGLATDEDRVQAQGKMLESVTFTFWLHFDWEDLSPAAAFNQLDGLLDSLDDLFSGEPPDLGDVLHLRTGFRVDGEAEVLLDVTGSSALEYQLEKALVPPYLLPPIPVGPLFFQPVISLTGRFHGGVAGSVGMRYGFDARFGLGFEYDDGLTPIVAGPTFGSVAPDASVTTTASLRAELELSLILRLEGFFGPYASLIAYGDLTLDRGQEPCYRFTAGMEGEVGASLGVFGYTLKNIPGPSFPLGEPLELGDGDCAAPPDAAPTDEPIAPWSTSYRPRTLSGVGTDESYTNVELSHDARLLVSSDTSEIVMKVEQSGAPVWARRFEQPSRPDFPRLHPDHAVPMLDTGILIATHELVLVKLDQTGELLWAAQLETDNDERGFWAARRVPGGLWLAGAQRRPASTERQAWLVGLDASGAVSFSWVWGQPDRREAVRHVLPLDDGALLVGEGDGRGFLLYVNLDGTIRWAKYVDDCAGGNLVLSTAILTDDDNLLVGGWFYATRTDGLLFRMSRDGAETEPAWATRTGVPGQILGPEIRSLHQLANTGELRVAGRYAEPTGDRVFAAMTDAIGRFGWLQRYGAPDDGASPATSFITSQGGLLLASGSATLEPYPGGFWLFEVPTPTGEIDFEPGSGVARDELTPESSAACLRLGEAPSETEVVALPVSSVEVLAHPHELSTRRQ